MTVFEFTLLAIWASAVFSIIYFAVRLGVRHALRDDRKTQQNVADD